MTMTGHIQNGVVVFDAPTTLPEGTVVEIAIRDAALNSVPTSGNVTTIYERYKDIIGSAVGLPEDFAENHDHYIHGTPKR